MIKFNKNKGFTLIELLVVIAIIGILAAIALTSLRTARNKAKYASAIGSLSSARAQAEIFSDDNGNNYDGVCGDPDIQRLITAADRQLGGVGDETPHAAPWDKINCDDTGTVSYTILADATALDTGSTGGYFCVDATGFAGKLDDASGVAAGDQCQP